MHFILFFIFVSFFAGAALGIDDLQTVEKPLYTNFQNKCIDDLGCFYTGPPFYHPVYRPISLPPVDGIETKFFLFTSSNQAKGEILKMTEESVKNSGFKDDLSTKVLIHPYLLSSKTAFTLQRIAKAFLKEGLYNVIMVEWGRYNKFPYTQALANGRVVGAQLAKLINLIIKYRGVTAESFHIIGHSMGAHVSGWAGERIPNLGRITGLDPAGPHFYKAENEARLDSTDATFVDIIHTNGGNKKSEGIGIDEPIGHMDFYPNGGKRQPGCIFLFNAEEKEDEDDEYYTFGVCSHMRVTRLFLDSISTCTFKAAQCEDYESYQKGDCDGNNTAKSEMGYRAQKIPGLTGSTKFFLNTREQSPFCM